MGADSNANSLLEKPVSSPLSSVASEDRYVSPENSQGESALLRLAELAEEFDAEQVAAERRNLDARLNTSTHLETVVA